MNRNAIAHPRLCRRIAQFTGGTVLALATTFASEATAAPLPQSTLVSNCFGCNLGIFDDATMTSNRGTVLPFAIKDIYVGIQYSSGFSQLSGIEFSITGLRSDVDGIIGLAFEPLAPGAVTIGTIPSPADTSATSVGTGGINIAWPGCLDGNRALVKISFFSFTPISNKVITLKRRYPTTNPTFWHTPIFVQCDAPVFSIVRVSGGCYGINVPPGPLPCDAVVGIERTTWSQVKSLYE